MNELRCITTDNLKERFRGGRSVVYALPEYRILKVFEGRVSAEELLRIVRISHEAKEAGLPVVRIYEAVNASGKLGLISDYLDGETLSDYMHGHTDRFEECAHALSSLSKQLANTRLSPNSTFYTNESYKGALDRLFGILSEEEINVYESAVDSIPRLDTVVHGDFHLRNIIRCRDSRLCMIDLDDLSCGHPIWDISSVAAAYRLNPEVESDAKLLLFSGLDRSECETMWNLFTQNYFSGLPKDEAVCRAEAAYTYSLVRALRMAADLYHPGDENTGHLGERNIRKNIAVLRQKLDSAKEIFKTWR